MKKMEPIVTILAFLLTLCLLSSPTIAEDQTGKINGLIERFSSENRESAVEAMRELVRIGEPAIPILVKKLETIDLKNQFFYSAFVLNTLKDIGKPAVEPLIEILEKSSRPETVKPTMTLLGSIGDKRATPHIVKRLKDPNAEIRNIAAQSLGFLRDKSAINSLLESLNDSEFYVDKDVVAWSLGLILERKEENKALISTGSSKPLKDEGAVDALIGLLGNSNPFTRVRAAISLGQIGNPTAVNFLIEILENDKEVSVKRAAIEGLSMIKDPRVAPPLLEAMKDKDLKWQVVNVLHRVEDESAVNALIELSKDKESYWRYEAVIALGKIKSPKTIEALKEALKDKDQEVGKKAEKALKGLGE